MTTERLTPTLSSRSTTGGLSPLLLPRGGTSPSRSRRRPLGTLPLLRPLLLHKPRLLPKLRTRPRAPQAPRAATTNLGRPGQAPARARGVADRGTTRNAGREVGRDGARDGPVQVRAPVPPLLLAGLSRHLGRLVLEAPANSQVGRTRPAPGRGTNVTNNANSANARRRRNNAARRRPKTRAGGGRIASEPRQRPQRLDELGSRPRRREPAVRKRIASGASGGSVTRHRVRNATNVPNSSTRRTRLSNRPSSRRGRKTLTSLCRGSRRRRPLVLLLSLPA
mmetsp:Transcript_13130/g.26957  ORF Transcript_13130/g.26957 Transcript_13130/m.26957 type:complete len:280 (+) Transcript_13130:1569-2408(+)